MRAVLPLIALLMCAPALADASAPTTTSQGKAANFIPNQLPGPAGKAVCNAHIQKARAERGLPKLDEGNASADQPLMILAVDKRIGGCSVMVMAYNANDVRPVPAEGNLRMIK